MTGKVTAHREAVLSIIVRNSHDVNHAVNAVVDTGYTGFVTLPSSLIATLGLRWKRFGFAMLADGSEITFDVYEGVVVWDGVPILADVDEVDADPLVGMVMMNGY